MAMSGFCFGGGLALRYGDLQPDKVKAVVVFYGRPLKQLQGLKSPVSKRETKPWKHSTATFECPR